MFFKRTIALNRKTWWCGNASRMWPNACLCLQLVYKVKANHLLDQLSPWSASSLDPNDLEPLTNQLNQCLHLISVSYTVPSDCSEQASILSWGLFLLTVEQFTVWILFTALSKCVCVAMCSCFQIQIKRHNFHKLLQDDILQMSQYFLYLLTKWTAHGIQEKAVVSRRSSALMGSWRSNPPKHCSIMHL